MKSVTLSQAADSCRDLVVNAIRQQAQGLTAQQLWHKLPAGGGLKLKELRPLLDELEADDIIEVEQYRTNVKVYFLYGRTPRVRVHVAPAQMSSAAMAPRTWVAPLGVAA